MIPDTIKDTIDLITVFGVNDAGEAFLPYRINKTDTEITLEPWEPPVFEKTENLPETKDEFWAAAEENTMGGDFDVTTLDGAIASTILKLQTRCPNAVIVFGTSWSGRSQNESGNTPTGNYTEEGNDFYHHALRVKTIANYYSIPVVDIWGTSGVNCFNRDKNNQDVVHPYLSHGKMMLARAWIGGLNGICPMLN